MAAPVDKGFTFGAAAEILGLPESKLRYWSQVGFVGPSRRVGTRQVFTFQDLVGVRAAKELVDRGFSAADIRRAIDGVRAALPAVDRPLDKLRVTWDGSALVVIDEGAAFEPSGQRVFDFSIGDLAARAAAVGDAATTPLPAVARAGAAAIAPPPAERTAYEWFLEGLRIEAEGEPDADGRAAECYRHAVAADPGLSAAQTNLGAVLYRTGDAAGARVAFTAALALDPDQPEARYNLASLLFEAGEIDLAASELRRVVQSVPHFADAHYNLATALERLGSRRQAAEHLERYLELVQDNAADDVSPWIDEARARLSRLK